MIRLRRHASAEELASLAVGELRARKATRIEAHVAGCDHCTHLRVELDGVPTILASAHYPPIPESVTVRIEAVIAVESRQRVAAQPASEASRRDLPTPHRRRADRPGWHLPGLSIPATRLVAAAGALAVLAGGGYAIASQGVSGPASTASGTSAAAPEAQQMSQGPEITYGGPKAQHTIHAVRSNTDFVAASLSAQAARAVHVSQATGASAAQPTFGVPGAAHAQGSPSGESGSAGSPGRLSGCINLIAAGRTVLLVDLAKFQHKPATLIVLAATSAGPAEAWMVGSSCTATDRDILDHVVLSHL